MGKLDGKVAIITGSTSGMGRDTAYLFAKEGAKVVVTGRNEERAKAAVDKIKAEGGEAIYVIADTSDLNSPQKIFDATMEAYGTVDILFNNAVEFIICLKNLFEKRMRLSDNKHHSCKKHGHNAEED